MSTFASMYSWTISTTFVVVTAESRLNLFARVKDVT